MSWTPEKVRAEIERLEKLKEMSVMYTIKSTADQQTFTVKIPNEFSAGNTFITRPENKNYFSSIVPVPRVIFD